jgi:hypothetical protein
MLARIWNQWPERIKLIEYYNLFVTKLKSLLLQCVFYDMLEFFSCTFELFDEV